MAALSTVATTKIVISKVGSNSMKLTGKRCAMAATLMLTTLMVTLPASAAVGPYVGIESGVSSNLNSNGESTAVFTPDGGGASTMSSASGKAKFHNGFVGGVTFGYALPGHLRPELEVDYRRNTAKNAEGAVSALTSMVNLWYDFESRSNYFYMGGGIGNAHLKLTEPQPLSTSSDDVFVYQFGAGVGYFINSQISIGLDYRYLATAARGSFDYGPYDATSSGVPGQLRVNDKLRLRSQSVMLGLRWNFGNAWDPLNPYRRLQSVRVVPLDSGD